MSVIKAIIFDWDGTLMDSHDYIIDNMLVAIEKSDLELRTREEIAGIIGLSMNEAIRALYPQLNENEVISFRQDYSNSFNDENQPQPKLFTGAKSLLQDLKSQQYYLAVATGKRRAGLEKGFAQSDTADIFNISKTADDAPSKPHPDMLHQIINEANLNADEVLMIGDSVLDLKMANNAGVKSIGVTTGSSSKESMLELQPLSVLDEIVHLQSFLDQL